MAERPSTPDVKFGFSYESRSLTTTPVHGNTQQNNFGAPYTGVKSSKRHTLRDKESIIVRVERPVVGLEFKPHLLIRSKENNVVEKTERLLQFEYLRSKTKGKLDCYYPFCSVKRSQRKPLFENLNTNRQYCSQECFRACWKPEDSSFDLKLNLEEKKDYSSSEIFKDVKLNATKRVAEDKIEWEVVSIGVDQAYIVKEEDFGHMFKVKCTALKSPTHQRGVTADAEVSASGESSITEPAVMLPFKPPRRQIVNRKSLNPFSNSQNASGSLNSTVTVLCYNVLAQIYTNRQLYKYTPLYLLSWKVRRKMILAEVLHYGGDLMCLQEVQQDHFHNFFKPQLEHNGYKCLYKMKTREGGEVFEQVHSTVRNKYKVDGCLTLYKANRFKLVENIEVEFNALAANDRSLTEEARLRLSKDNVAQITVLRDISSHEVLMLANTHLHWDPDFSDVKLWQTSALIKYIDNVQQNLCHRLNITTRNVPIIICGDFNSMPKQTPINYIKQNFIDKDKVFDPLGLFSTFSYAHSLQMASMYEDIVGEEPTVTNYTGQFKGTIDYVFASDRNVCGLRALEVPSQEELEGPDESPLPNSRFPSDHVAHFVELQLNYSYGTNLY